MRLHFLTILSATGAVLLAGSAHAQLTRIYTAPLPGRARVLTLAGEDQPRAALGLTTSPSPTTSSRDTLGLLVSSIVPNGPAERAGIEEGNRLQSINGVNLRVAPADIGDWEMGHAMSRRLTRELGKLRPGDEAELRVYASGQARSIRVKTVDSDSLYGRRRESRSGVRDDDRPTLGITIASTTSRRDTLGVLVLFVADSGPAARAGIAEGNRIAAIDGTDLRVSRGDAGDEFIGNAMVRRLQREIAEHRPGDEVELRVYTDGQFRNLRLRVARASDLPRRHRAFMITGDGLGIMPSIPLMRIDGEAIGGEVRRALERAMEASGRALEGVGRGLTRSWNFDEDVRRQPDDESFEPLRLEHLEPSTRPPVQPSRFVPFRTAVLSDTLAPTALAATFSRSASTGAADVAVNVAGLRLVPVGHELATYLGRGSERGLLVIDVPEWAKGAIDAGDVVLRIDGRDVRGGADLQDITVDLPRFSEAQVDLMRDGRKLSVTIPARR